ncbi:MAG: serine/threonine transporter SstT [Succinivibrio sp.]|nr:serine/threonine transporter SstT [Succinivibrio sp.]
MSKAGNYLRQGWQKYNSISLILRIALGLMCGAVLGLIFPSAGWIGILGSLFVGALKAIAPLLVFVLVITALTQSHGGFDRKFTFVIFEYLFSTFLAAVVAVLFCYAYPLTITLGAQAQSDAAPGGLGEILEHLLLNMMGNPLRAIGEANYLAVLFWGVIFGVLMKKLASEGTKQTFADLSLLCAEVVRGIIALAPVGILGLVFDSVSQNGLEIFYDYGRLILLLVTAMLTVALAVNPLIVWAILRKNPYPLVWRCLKESGVTAFFTRSSAANIPVNMSLCQKLGLNKDLYSISIPLGSTINMDGAAVVITVMTLVTVNTLGLSVDLGSALLLSLLSTIAACGTSGVAGGSLLLIPVACSLFGISNDVAMQVVGVGFIISVIQDSLETALNSSADVLFTATADYHYRQEEGRALPDFLGGESEVKT